MSTQSEGYIFAVKDEAVCHFHGEHKQPAADAGAAHGTGLVWHPPITALVLGESGRPGSLSMGTKLRTFYFWRFA